MICNENIHELYGFVCGKKTVFVIEYVHSRIKEDDMNTIGENILTLRRGLGLSQEAVAEKIDVSRQTVAKWEAGESTPDLALAAELAAVFGISIDRLAGKNANGGKYIFGAVKIGERGQISIPKKCREVFGLQAGDYLMVLGDIDRGIAMMKLSDDMYRFDEGSDDE